MTAIRTADGWRYVLSDGDLVWLGRAADSEGGQPADTIWTWLQRLALPQFRGRTLSALVQGHSQAVNPDWSDGGRFCAPGGTYAGTADCAPARLRARALNRAKGWTDLRASTRAAITALKAGRLNNPVPGAVDFAAPSTARAFLDRNPGAQLVAQRSNWFIATAESLRWPAGFVRLEGGIGLGGFVALVGLGSAAIVGLGWWFWGRR